ncbi:MAG: CRTAC1 family protein [Pirellulaceae bacterium]|nr:CRTAC1 family protein [Pirellulaceae bacterium]
MMICAHCKLWLRGELIRLCLIMIVLCAGCKPGDDGRETDNNQINPVEASVEEIHLEEFKLIAEQIADSENAYLGTGQVPRLQAALQQSEVPHQDRVNLLLQLCWNQLRLGSIDDAADSIRTAFEQVKKHQGKLSPSMIKLQALVYLREAEYRNCVEKHNRECCLFPLAEGGIHSEPSPMLHARETLLKLLAMTPRDLEAAWLLNVSAMATNEYPNAIPEQYRLPAERMQSEYQIGRFVDVAGKLGVDTFNLCGGAITEDFNGDGVLDVMTSTYDPAGSLTYYESDGRSGYRDVSQRSQVNKQLGGLNCLAADFDNDGDMDVLVLRGAWLGDQGQMRNSLLANDGKGNFRDVTAIAGLSEVAYPTQAATWLDMDNDGDLDLYVGNESRVEIENGAGDFPSQLFRNNGDGTFLDIASQAGVCNDRYCKGVASADYDNDGDVDLYVSNRGVNRLYRNNADGTFTDVAEQALVSDPRQQSFACWFFDYDNDQWLDLFVAAYQSTNADVAADYWGLPHRGVSPCLYRNLRDGTFEDVTKAVGLDHAYLPMGANFGDLDNDGFLDIYLTTGRPDFAALMPNVMLRNDGGKRFQDVSIAGGFGHLQKGHGVAFADLDNDGDQDIYHQLGGFYPGDRFHNALFLNPGNEHHFLTVYLRGRKSNSRGVGARISVYTDGPGGKHCFHRAVGAVSSFGGSPIRQEIGLGHADRVAQVRIQWPGSPGEQIIEGLPIDSTVEITEGLEGFRLRPLPELKFPATN